jgi:intermembrane space import and assembly protein 40
MQDCFRQHPDIYGAELEDDDEPQSDAPQTDAPASPEAEVPPPATVMDASSEPIEKQARAKEVNAQAKADAIALGDNVEGDSLIPKAAHDTEEKN